MVSGTLLIERKVCGFGQVRDSNDEMRTALIYRNNSLEEATRDRMVAYMDPFEPLASMQLGTIRAVQYDRVELVDTWGRRHRQVVAPGHCWINRGGGHADQDVSRGLIRGSVLMVWPLLPSAKIPASAPTSTPLTSPPPSSSPRSPLSSEEMETNGGIKRQPDDTVSGRAK